MLSQVDNEALCRVGPGTLMGNFFREYWLPALQTGELPDPDCPPVRIKLLGEELIAFRDTTSAVGLIDNNCPHRRASLFFGRNEESGLRCVYHGWKFDVNGECVDMPSEPAESNFKDKVKIKSYPTHERNGVIWAYMGPKATPPALPELEGNMHGSYYITVLFRNNNWMQGIEGEIDTVHASILHGGHVLPENVRPGSFTYYQSKNRAGKFKVQETPVGNSYGMYRVAEEDSYYWRVGHYLFPCFAMPPVPTLGMEARFLAYVPMDDEHTLEWSIGVREDDGLAISARQAREYLGNGTGWYDRYVIEQNWDNDFQIDREAQRTMTSWSGISGVRQQDMAMTEGMGVILDRTSEHLGTTDQMIIRTRRMLLRAARALAEDGTPPPGVENPQDYHLRSGQVILSRDADWWEDTRDLRERFEAGAAAAEAGG